MVTIMPLPGDGTVDHRISLKKLEILCMVVAVGGVGGAADRLRVSQPVVTAHMRLLQDRLGVELLYRDGQQMKLTEAGEEVYRWAREVLGRSRELARTLQGIADGDAGAVVLGASMSVGSYLLPPVLGVFARQRPEAAVTLHVLDSEDAQRAAESGEYDFAVITGRSALADRTLRATRIGDHDLVLVAAPTDGRVGETVTAAELAEIPFVCSPARRPRRRLVDEVLAQVGITRRRVVLELGHPEALKAVTRMGTGVCLLMRAAVQDDLRAGTLREVAIAGRQLRTPVVLVHRIDKRFTPMQQQLIESLVAATADRPAPHTAARPAVSA
jgi:DNA-binding transcriptional LysR family regulator